MSCWWRDRLIEFPKIWHFNSAHRMGWVYKWNWTDWLCLSIRHHFEDGQYLCSKASQTPITIHILKAYDESYSKIIKEHKYKDKDNDKEIDKVPEVPSMLYLWNPDDSLILIMMIDTSPSSSCSRRFPRSPCSCHRISSTGPSVSSFRDFLKHDLHNL